MVKITALPPMASPDGADQAPVVDDSVSTTKKITLTQMKAWLQTFTDFITSAMLPAGATIQSTGTQYSASATGTTVMPFDDTLPQNTEGDQYMSHSFTPKFASSKLIVQVSAWSSHTAANAQAGVALFKDSDANALACGEMYENTGTAVNMVTYSYEMTAGTTSPITFKVRIGSQNAGTTTFNGQSGSRRYGGAIISSLRVKEVRQ